MAQMLPDYHITSVVFGDRWLDVQFVVPDEGASVRVLEEKLWHIDPTLVEDEVGDLLDTLRDIITKAGVERRHG